MDLAEITELNPHQFKYRGTDVNQRYGVWKFLDELALEMTELPTTIIELGTMHGGFTLFLSEHPISEKAQIHTFDIKDRELSDFFKDMDKVTFHCCDLFMKKVFIKQLIEASKGPVVVFCDGGNKKKEFNMFAPILRPGDHILGHDYVKNAKVYKEKFQGKIWNWHELSFDKIEEAVKSNNLEPFLEDLAAEYVWASYRKK